MLECQLLAICDGWDTDMKEQDCATPTPPPFPHHQTEPFLYCEEPQEVKEEELWGGRGLSRPPSGTFFASHKTVGEELTSVFYLLPFVCVCFSVIIIGIILSQRKDNMHWLIHYSGNCKLKPDSFGPIGDP